MPPRHNYFLILFCFFAVVFFCNVLITVVSPSDFTDFGNYYFYAKTLGEGYPIYQLSLDKAHMLAKHYGMPEFIPVAAHDPVFFLAMRCFSWLSYHSSALLWLLLNLVLSCVVLVLTAELVAGERLDKKIRRLFVLTVAAFALLFWPLTENLYSGQVNLWIVLFFLLSLFAVRRNHLFLAGVFLACAVVIKPYWGILALIFIVKRMWRAWFGLVCGFAIARILSIATVGIATEIDYWTRGVAWLCNNYASDMSLGNLSAWGLVNRLMNLTVHHERITLAFALNTILMGALFCYAFWQIRRRYHAWSMRFVYEFCLILVAVLLCFTVTHEHHYVLLFIPMIASLRFLYSGVPGRSSFFLFLFFFMLVGFRYSLGRLSWCAQGPGALFSGTKLFGVAALFLLVQQILKKDYA